LAVALAALTSVSPRAGLLTLPVFVLLAVAATHPAATGRVSACVALALLAVLTTTVPPVAVLAAVGICAAALGARGAWRARWWAGRTIGRLIRPMLVLAVPVAAGLGIAGVGIGVATYPATTLLVVLVVGILVLARHSPPLALGAAVLLYSFEGSVKLLLGLDGTPLPGDNRAAGAAALDLALFAAVAGVLLSDRFRSPRAIWASASRLERVVIGLIGAWLALSVGQIVQGGDVNRGLHGFRLFQLYTLVALATLVVFLRPRLRLVATRVALAIGLVVSLYAAVRVVIGHSDAEREFALAVPTITFYGDTVRAIGSFSSAIGLSSFMAPTAVFALALGLLSNRLRVFAWTVAGLALVGLIGSFSRASLFGVVLGLVFGLLLVLFARDTSLRWKLTCAGLVVFMVLTTYGGLLVASQASPALRERAQGVLDPLGDESVRLRLATWERTLDDVADHPLGQGVGAVGAASSETRVNVRTTDNSFLKVLVEQGVIGLALFVAGMLGAVLVLARRLRRTAEELRPVGLAALAGFVTFLGISFAGESVEQPGKIVAWGLLGVAVAHAFGGAARASDREAA
jgi:O-antigen ligase